MICKVCGSEISGASGYCEVCGAPVEAASQPQEPIQQSQPAQEARGTQPGQNVYVNQQQAAGQSPYVNQQQSQQPPQKKKNTGLIIGIIAGAAALFIIAAVVVAIFIIRNKTPKQGDILIPDDTTEVVGTDPEEWSTETSETTTEETTETTTEAEAVPYFVEKRIKFTDPKEKISCPAYVFPSGDGGFFDRIESEKVYYIDHEMDYTITDVQVSEPDEDGYVITKIFYDSYLPIEYVNNGYEGKWNPQIYISLMKFADFNTGLICGYNSLDIGMVKDGEHSQYESVASEGNASIRDDAFYKENMIYTDVEYDGSSYQVGIVYGLISRDATKSQLVESTDEGDRYTRNVTYHNLAFIYAPEGCRVILALEKKGTDKEYYDKDLERHEKNASGEATENDPDKKETPYIIREDQTPNDYYFIDPGFFTGE